MSREKMIAMLCPPAGGKLCEAFDTLGRPGIDAAARICYAEKEKIPP